MRAWMLGVTVLPSSHDGGSMTGSDPYAVWHSYEAPYQLTALNAAKSLIRAGNEVQFTFHPLSGDIVQILPANRAGRGLVNKAGGVQTNRQGRVCAQIEVIAYARRPWTLDLTPAGRRGLARLVAYLRELGVPDRWPAGPPPAYPNGSDPRSVRVWNGPGGHFSHSQVPENTHGDPGAIDIKQLFAAPLEDDMALSADDKKWLTDLVHSEGWAYRNPDVEKTDDAYAILRDIRAGVDALKAQAAAGVITQAQVNEGLRTVLGSLDNQATA